MATIATLSVKVVAIVDDVEAKVNRVIQKLTVFQRLGSGITVAWEHVKEGFHKTLDAWDSLRTIGPHASVLSQGIAGIAQAFLGLTAAAGAIAAVAALVVIIAGFIVFTVAAAAVVGLTAALWKLGESGVENLSKIAHQARMFGIEFNQMRVILEHAALARVPNNTLERWFSHLEEQLGGVVNGAAESDRVFRLLGIDAAALASQDLGSAMGSIFGLLRDLPSQYERARVASRLFGRDFRTALDISNNPNIRTQDIRGQLSQRGQLLSASEVSVVVQAEGALHRLSAVWDGVKSQLGVHTAPLFIALAEGLDRVIRSAGGLKIAMLGAFDVILIGAEATIGALAAMLTGLQMLLRASGYIAQLNPATNAAGRAMVDAVSGENWGLRLERNWDRIAIRAREIHSLMTSLSRREGVSAAGAVGALAAGNPVLAVFFAAAMQRVSDTTGSAVARLNHFATALRRWMDGANRFTEGGELPRFLGDLNDLRGLVSERMLTPPEGGLAAARLVEELENKLGMTAVRQPPALEVQSREASEAIAALFNSRDRLDVQARIEQLMMQAAERDRQRLRYSQEIRDALIRLEAVR